MLQKRTQQVLFISIVSMFCLSCGKDSACFKGSGKKITEQRAITNEITSITIGNKINLVITQSNEPNLILEGGENLLPYINTDISGNELTISSDNKCGFLRDSNEPLTVYISISNLIRIEYTGHGTITNTGTLSLQKLDIESFGGTGSLNLSVNAMAVSVKQHSGPADFTIRGNVKTLFVYTLGSGWFYLEGFIAQSAHVNHSGIGDVLVNASSNLSVELRSRGDLLYYGNPIVSIDPHVGSGDIIKKP